MDVARESFRLIIDGVDGCPPYKRINNELKIIETQFKKVIT